MTLLRTSNAPIGLDRGKPISTETLSDGWIAPSDWLTFTDPSPSEQKVIGTVAVYDQDSNYISLQATITDGYTVDWGDGTSNNYASAAIASKNYSWSSISSGTLTSSGYRQAIITITPQVAGRTFSNLQLSRRNTAIANITTSSSPWLNMSIAAPNATRISFAFDDAINTDRLPCSQLEQVKIISSNVSDFYYMFSGMVALQNVVINTSATINSTTQMFLNCRLLKTAPFLNTASVPNFNSMFNGCASLLSVPLYNTQNAGSMASMFNACVSLESVPLFNTANVTLMNNMFQSCFSLKSVPLFNTANVTSMASTFSGCSSLITVPLFNTANVTSMASTFSGCSSLKSVPLFNTANVGLMNGMFQNCTALESVPLFNTANVTSMQIMFSGCNSLQIVPSFDTSLVTTMSNMFSTNFTLRQIPSLNLRSISSLANNNLSLGNTTIAQVASSLARAVVNNMKYTQTFQNCQMGATQLNEMYTSVATLNPAVTNASGSGTAITYTVGTGFISSFVVGRTVTVSGIAFPAGYNITGTVASVNAGAGTFTINNSATGIYTSGGIAAITSDRTITVTGNPGTATDNPTIATNKGWTVTG